MIAGLVIHSNVHLTVTGPHVLSTERTLARIVGGSWWPRTDTVPDPNLYQLANGALVGHPATIGRITKKVPAA